MADDVENDDQWLYGENPDLPAIESSNNAEDKTEEELLGPEIEEGERVSESEPPPPGQETPEREQTEEQQQDDENGGNEEGEIERQNGDGTDKEDEDEDSDDDVNVVIGDIKTSPTYSSINIKRGGLLTATSGDKSKQQQQPGKFSVEEFDQGGTINGVPAAEFNLDSLEDKPWRKPGADITDYFNYGFNEDTWRAYCERQKRMRVNESGVGLAPLSAIGMPRGPVPIMNDNSKYSGNFTGLRKAGPPPGRRMTGAIDVIGGPAQKFGPPLGKMEPPKENVIQVMTADRREYSRKPPGFPDLSMPPPGPFEEFQPEYGFNPEPEPFYGGYEPTQDSQWGPDNPSWQPQEIRALSGGPPILPSAIPPVLGPPMDINMGIGMGLKDNSPMRRRSRDRDASRSRSEKPRDRDRERSHRRDRSRSRSRRHKSRSRSPSHRSHRKKKSRRHEESD